MASDKQSPLDIFRQKKFPIVRSCRLGSNKGDLLAPKGIAVDPTTDNILIADEGNNRVQVFDSLGKHLYFFGRDLSRTVQLPYGIKVMEGFVFVSQYAKKSVCVYTTGGEFVCSILNPLFFWPTGLDVVRMPDGDICLYVCSSANSCVLALSNNGNKLICGTKEGSSGKFVQPKDVKLLQDKLLVLDLRNPCLHMFSLEGEYQKSIVSNGIGRDVAGPLFFCVDQSGLIIVGDNQSSRVKAFSVDGTLLHEVGVYSGKAERFVRSSSLMSHLVHLGINHRATSSSNEGLVKSPRGLALDTKRRLVVIGLMDVDCLQIF